MFTLPKKHQTIVLMNSMFCSNIVLIGFMGTGKTAVAKYLSEKYELHMIDMDQVLSERVGKSIADIFATSGEAYFREQETNLLTELQQQQQVVISCGGGAAMAPGNVWKMKEIGSVVLLTASPETIHQRVQDDEERPILKGRNTIEFISELMEKRRKKYEVAADIVIQTDDKTIPQICEELIEKVVEISKR